MSNKDYLNSQLITYLGNKRKLLPNIEKIVIDIKQRLDKKQLRLLDLFSGSGSVSRLFKNHASYLVVNDQEHYCDVISECYLANHSEVDLHKIKAVNEYFTAKLNTNYYKDWMGIIEANYAPKDDNNMVKSDRAFYTKENAKRLDFFSQIIIDTISEKEQSFYIAPLLSEASIHVNTGGRFTSFYKDKNTGIPQFGGTKSWNIKRILGTIELNIPIFSENECEYKILNSFDDMESTCICNLVEKELKNIEFDIAYIDPPYNDVRYGSSYFMLNILAKYEMHKHYFCQDDKGNFEYSQILDCGWLSHEYASNRSRISGILDNWNRSIFNSKENSLKYLKYIVNFLNSKFIVISYNPQKGFITLDQLKTTLSLFGKLEIFEIDYVQFKSGRGDQTKTIEYLFLLEKKLNART